MKKEEIIIRKATGEDFEVVNSLYYETYSLYHKNIPLSYKKTPKNLLPKGTFLDMLENKNTLVAVAELDNQVVGVLYATIEKEESDDVVKGYHRVSVEELPVLPGHRRKGIGSILMKEAENWAREHKIFDLAVLVYVFNKKAVKFYESNGYEPYSLKLNKRI